METGVVFQVWTCAWHTGYSSVPRFPQLKQYDNALTYPMLYGGSVVHRSAWLNHHAGRLSWAFSQLVVMTVTTCCVE